MKTSPSMMPEKSFPGISTFLLIVSLICSSQANAQSYSSVSSVSNQVTFNKSEFRASAFPVLSPMQVRIVFENPTFHQVHVSVLNSKGKIMYGRSYASVPKYYGILDFSQLPTGDYLLQISCGPKIGKKKSYYRQTFQIRSQTERSIIAWDTQIEKQLFTKKSFISGR